MNCPACWRWILSDECRRDLEPAIFDVLRPVLPIVEQVTLHGAGEPLVCRYFSTYLEAVCSARVPTYFTTNGLLLKADVAQQVVRAGVATLSVSLSAADRLSYARIHGRDHFEDIVRNVRCLNELKSDLRSATPVLSVSFIAARDTLPHLAGVIDLASKLGCYGGVFVSHLVAYKDSQLQSIASAAVLEFEQAFEAASSRAAQLGVPLIFKSRNQTLDPVPVCTRPWDSAYVRCDGTVFVCTESGDHPLGNLSSGSFPSIWRGPAAQEFRRASLSGENLCCRYCTQCSRKKVGRLVSHLGGALWRHEVEKLEAGAQVEGR